MKTTDELIQEAHTKGTQEALAKVEEWVRENGMMWSHPNEFGVAQIVVNADDLLHHLQQLKDNLK